MQPELDKPPICIRDEVSAALEADLLRDVQLPGGYRLQLADTGRHDRDGRTTYAYRLSAPHRAGADEDFPGQTIFEGCDYRSAAVRSHADDSDDALVALLGFLALKPGDTDPEYFERYTEGQLAWSQSDDAETLATLVFLHEDAEGHEPATFEDWSDDV